MLLLLNALGVGLGQVGQLFGILLSLLDADIYKVSSHSCLSRGDKQQFPFSFWEIRRESIEGTYDAVHDPQ